MMLTGGSSGRAPTSAGGVSKAGVDFGIAMSKNVDPVGR
jgi:hypothetical protein